MHKENSTQNLSSVCHTLIYSYAHWSKPDTRHLFFDASPSMSGVRLRDEEIFRIEWRCSSVRRLLCDVLFILIQENNCSHRYVLPNIESIWAAWVWSWGIVTGMNRGNRAAPTESWFDLGVWQHWSSISSIWRWVGALSTSTANILLSSSNLHFWASKSANRRVNSALSFSTNCTWKHVGRDLLFNVLAARKMVQVFLQHLSLPQAQLGLARGFLNVNRRRVLINTPTH